MNVNVIICLISIIVFIIDLIELCFIHKSVKDKTFKLVFIMSYLAIAILIVIDIILILKYI